MSTLTVATVKSNSSSPPTFQNTSGTEVGTLCRAWVNFNGQGTVAIRAQFNVSSITDNGAGDFTVNLSNALADANFVFSGGGTDDNATPRYIYERGTYAQYRTSSAFRFFCATPGVAVGDAQGIYVAIFR